MALRKYRSDEVRAGHPQPDAPAPASAQGTAPAKPAPAASSTNDGIESFRSQIAALKAAEQAPKHAQPDPIETILAQPIWLDSEREFLRARPHAFAKSDVLNAAHIEAARRGHARGSPEYFAILEDALQNGPPPAPSPSPPPAEPRIPVAAPASRSVPSWTNAPTSPSKVTLTPAQREHARASGISEIEYAKGVLRLEALKKAGHYTEQG